MKFVIEHGNTMISAKCRKCGCRYMYQENDIEFEYDRINADESDLKYSYVRCPECGAELMIEVYE